MSATAAHHHSPDVLETPMKAVILYDDSRLAAKAAATLSRAAHRAETAGSWSVSPWRVDLLHLPPSASEALNEAAEAHLLVLAVRTQDDLSSELQNWLEGWAARRQVQDAALAIVEGAKGGSLSTGVTPHLSRFAERQGLSFILNESDPSEENSNTPRSSRHERSAGLNPTSLGISEETHRHRYRDGGINE